MRTFYPVHRLQRAQEGLTKSQNPASPVWSIPYGHRVAGRLQMHSRIIILYTDSHGVLKWRTEPSFQRLIIVFDSGGFHVTGWISPGLIFVGHVILFQ